MKPSEPAINSNAIKVPTSIRYFFSNEGLFFSIWPYHLLRLGLAVIFIWSGAVKLQQPEVFAVLIESYGLAPESWVPSISYLLPILEVVAGVGLVFDLKGYLGAITLLLICFLFILGYGIHMGLDVDCGCFGPNDPEAKAYHGLRSAFYRDMILIGAIAYLYAWRYRRQFTPFRLTQLFQKRQRR